MKKAEFYDTMGVSEESVHAYSTSGNHKCLIYDRMNAGSEKYRE